MTTSLFSIESHPRGNTYLNYDDKLDYVITGGVDGHIKAFSGLTSDNVFSYKLPTGINSIVIERDRIFSASASNRIESHSIIDKSNKAVLSQFSSNINYLQINSTKTRLVACSDDFSVKIIKLDSDVGEEVSRSKRESIYDGHQAPVISVAINATSDMIASSSCDGSIIVWDIDTKRNLRSMDLLKKYKDICDVRNYCRIKWSPTKANILAIPLDNEIRLIDCRSWLECGRYSWSNVTANNVTELAFDSEGKYLAAGTTDGWIILWDCVSKHLLSSWQSSRRGSITSLAWYRNQPPTLLFADTHGFWEAIRIDTDRLADTNVEQANDGLTTAEIEAMFDDIAAEDFQEDDEIETDKISVASTSIIDDGDDDGNDHIDDGNDTEMDDADADDDNLEISLSEMKAQFASPTKNDIDSDMKTATTTTVVHVQRDPHQPVRSTHCPRSNNMQLVLWNAVAAIKHHYETDTEAGFLEVDFQDCQVHRNLVYRHDHGGLYDMGDVNEQALLLVSVAGGMDDCARVHVRPLNASWQQWDCLLPSGERPVGCCLIGDEYALVLSDRCLRYFLAAAGGLQVHVESLHGSPVAIASAVSDDNDAEYNGKGIRVVLVVDDGAQLVWRLEELLPGKRRLADCAVTIWHPLPLSATAKLDWIGFSDGGALYSVDSLQCVRRMRFAEVNDGDLRSAIPRWLPVLDYRYVIRTVDEGRHSDRYYTVGFVDRAEQMGVMVVKCRNSHYPKLVPWPHLEMVPFQLPLCAPQSEVTALEQSLMLNQLVPSWSEDNRENLIQTDKQLLLKLFGMRSHYMNLRIASQIIHIV